MSPDNQDASVMKPALQTISLSNGLQMHELQKKQTVKLKDSQTSPTEMKSSTSNLPLKQLNQQQSNKNLRQDSSKSVYQLRVAQQSPQSTKQVQTASHNIASQLRVQLETQRDLSFSPEQLQIQSGWATTKNSQAQQKRVQSGNLQVHGKSSIRTLIKLAGSRLTN